MRVGPKLQLTESVIDEYARLMPSVLHVGLVSDFLGFHERTVREWLGRGKREFNRRERGNPASSDPDDRLYLKFYKAHIKAIAAGEMALVASVRKASALSWHAAAWLLERRFGERWASDNKLVRELEAKIAELEEQLQQSV